MDSSRSRLSQGDHCSFTSSVYAKSEQERKDKHLFFHKYERLRINEMFEYSAETKIKNRSVNDQGLDQIKTTVTGRLLGIRNGCEEIDEEGLRKIEKQKKFCNFILHL